MERGYIAGIGVYASEERKTEKAKNCMKHYKNGLAKQRVPTTL